MPPTHKTSARRNPSIGTSAHREADESLAAALLAGEPGAATQAWTRLSPLVLRILGGCSGSGADRQDLCQETFLRFFSRIRELRDQRALRNFLIGICLGVAANERRRARVRQWINLAADGDLPDQAMAAPDIEAREALRGFQRILAGIDAESRSLFVVRYVEKMELADIADASGWALATTKRRVARVTRRVGLRMMRDPALADYAARLLPSRV
jgi:RNA polymerase sigma-70 factor, ECF subfamily